MTCVQECREEIVPENSCKNGVCTLTRRKVQTVGPAYFNYYRIAHQNEQSVWLNSNQETEEEIEEDVSDDIDDLAYLKSLDPKECKDQDHYRVLGLGNKRYKASENDIRLAYRKKVLRHHPDKRKARGEKVDQDNDYFVCISKAYDILGVSSKRRSYDSVDPEVDDGVPTANEYTKKNFYQVFGAFFEMNSRWSERQPVPKLGGPDAKIQEVEKFYSFWYNFQSWRDFSYLDEEEKDSGMDREQRKWIDKQNKAMRVKRKKEEMVRIRSLVDLAYSMDPRVAAFKQEELDRKAAAKKAKQDAVRAARAEQERVEREAVEKVRQEKEEKEREEKTRLEAEKKQKEALKKAMKKERKIMRDFLKEKDYFVEDLNEKIPHLTGMDKLCEMLSLIQLQELNNNMKEHGREAFLDALSECERKLDEERRTVVEAARLGRGVSLGTNEIAPANEKLEITSNWTPEHLQLLIKAVNMFPAGTVDRWECVANFLNSHASGAGIIRTPKEVLDKAKTLQKSDHSRSALREQVNSLAFDKFQNNQKREIKVVADGGASERFDTPAAQAGRNPAPWTNDEQQLLEQALKKFPNGTEERWDRIAEAVPTRSKKDCMKRYKELVEMVRAKQTAKQSTENSTGK
ncbi:hypothetical protein FOCC_FOCC016084 [Frankliniella occidentalis]|uniref:DnaJ homolog subfamily C member 2 n=1 Tax=Frankliniella occidentalis TaxID=133901 RepID=A0A6J1SH57_FRAOC|nr:dnaJ homolog subfamily C member 2 [Frankliniella occidentalis]KAE8738433.1 hypothetical protein FOCC_FOCC016084 [Frankliniella occidentalis]